MATQFEVEFTSRLAFVNQWAIDGWVKEGTLSKGDELLLVELDKEVKVREVALEVLSKQEEGRVTFSIDEPEFDFYQVTRGMTFRKIN